MTEVRPLYYVGRPTEEARLALRAGKELLRVDWLVQPTEAKPGVEGPVIAFEDPGFFITSYARLTPPYTATRMAAALGELYGLEDPDHLTTGEDWLAGLIPGARLLEEEQ